MQVQQTQAEVAAAEEHPQPRQPYPVEEAGAEAGAEQRPHQHLAEAGAEAAAELHLPCPAELAAAAEEEAGEELPQHQRRDPLESPRLPRRYHARAPGPAWA